MVPLLEKVSTRTSSNAFQIQCVSNEFLFWIDWFPHLSSSLSTKLLVCAYHAYVTGSRLVGSSFSFIWNCSQSQRRQPATENVPGLIVDSYLFFHLQNKVKQNVRFGIRLYIFKSPFYVHCSAVMVGIELWNRKTGQSRVSLLGMVVIVWSGMVPHWCSALGLNWFPVLLTPRALLRLCIFMVIKWNIVEQYSIHVKLSF